MRAWRLYLRSPAAVLGALLVLLVAGMGLAGALPVSGRPARPRGTAAAMAGRQPALPARHRSVRARHRGADVPRRAGLAADRFRRRPLIAVAIGIAIGALAGYYGGPADTALMRVTEAFQTLPNFLLLLLLVAVFGSELWTITVAIGAVSWPPVGAADAGGVPVAPRRGSSCRPARLQGLSRRAPDPAGDAAQRAAAGDRLRERGDGGLDPAGERARPSSSSRTRTCPPGAT